jgi:hypothetical protein
VRLPSLLFNRRTIVITLGAATLGIMADDCSGQTASQQQSQQITEEYQQAAQDQVRYPLFAMKAGGWLERRLLVENLLRQNDKNRIAYVYLISATNTLLGSWIIQGMVFDMNSMLTTENVINGCGSGSGACGVVTKAAGDNGTWGPEPDMIGFFTTSGVEVKISVKNATLIESDSPQNFDTKPIITYNAQATPSVNHGGVQPVSGH